MIATKNRGAIHIAHPASFFGLDRTNAQFNEPAVKSQPITQ
jgi:hypothetical protein